MALPSSPPLLPETELPSSPPPLRFDSSDQLRRKRHLPDYDSLSSDPIFSDDNSSTGAEDQSSCPRPKRKRMVKGPWWTLGRWSRKPLMDPNNPPRPPRVSKKNGFRNVDSGVWMGSDSSDDSVTSVLSSSVRLQELDVDDTPPGVSRVTRDAESVAVDIINGCVEACKESVDLSDIGLLRVSGEMLRPLHQLIRLPNIHLWRPPSEDEFSPLTPSIKLFLASNRLSALPTELFALKNLCVLSLRGNELTGLPPAIGRLDKLYELNIAGNGIRYLPWELLSLLKSRDDQNQIIIRPNPLIQPFEISGPSTLPRLPPSSKSALDNLSRYGDTRDYIEERRQWHLRDGTLDARGELELRLRLGRMLRTQYLQEASRAGNVVTMSSKELVFLAASDVRFFTVNGSLCRRRGAAGRAAELEDTFAARIDPLLQPPAPFDPSSSRVPSLFELATRSVQEHCDWPDLGPDLSECLPTAVGAAIREAVHGIEEGDKKCSTCGRRYIITRAEWMEFWFNGVASQSELTQESVLPFLRKACSWACARPTEVGEFAC